MARERTDDGIYLVDDAIFAAQEAHRMIEGEKQGEIQPCTIGEILYIASVVARQRAFPVDAVNSVLEFAGVLLVFQAETSERRRGRDNMNEEYLRLQLPSAEELQIPARVNVSRCVLVVADCTSKDQGWATDAAEHNGTYRASSSWSEVAVASTNAEGGDTEVGRAPFCPNLRAGRHFRHHRKYFDGSTKLLSQIALGNSVALVLRSQYPGWTNSATYGRLAVCFAVEFEEDFSFADVSFPTAFSGTAGSEGAALSSPISCAVQ
ncbi:hypothetical protein BBJ28_00000478 [Nothophytophthora sp. Chile5]|nr:hypothetical protein BBJ28_00000478 [Nothophytophthora sp. Chile5]